MYKQFLFVGISFLCSVAACAQTNQVTPGEPPKYIQVVVEEVVPGKVAAHNRLETAWTDALKKVGPQRYYLGASSIAGPSKVMWLMLYNNLGELEKNLEQETTDSALRSVMERYSQQDAEYIRGLSTTLARRRDDLSYRPDFNFGEYRYFALHTFHSKLAHARDAGEVLKTFNAAREKTGSDIHIVVYEVMSGDAEGTLLSLVPRKSLAEMEVGDQRMQQAVGEEGWRHIRELADAGGFTLDNSLFEFNPSYSNVPAEIASVNPGFWKPKAGAQNPPKARIKVPSKKQHQ